MENVGAGVDWEGSGVGMWWDVTVRLESLEMAPVRLLGREYGESRKGLRVLDWLRVTLGEGLEEQGGTI